MFVYTYRKIISALLRIGSSKISQNDGLDNNPVILDTAIDSDNAGDLIIMESCNTVIQKAFHLDTPPLHLPTHSYDPRSENVAGRIKVLCGTNILYKQMNIQKQLNLPNDPISYSDICLLGVGMSDIGIDEKTNAYTKLLFKALLSNQRIHSVRDSRTQAFLKEIGFSNVVNTSCPTMWSLTPELIRTIPKCKAPSVITSITDYCFDPEKDKYLLETLKHEYENVYIWVQGIHDIDWCLQNIVDLSEYKLIGSSLTELDSMLIPGKVDYIGTRLHAGIRALNHGVRALIVVVDNRARSISADTGLPCIERSELSERLPRLINDGFSIEIKLPDEAINSWMKQWG